MTQRPEMEPTPPHSMFVEGLETLTDEQRTSLAQYMGSLGLKWQGLPTDMPVVEDEMLAVDDSKQNILANPRYADAPVSKAYLDRFAFDQGQPNLSPWEPLFDALRTLSRGVIDQHTREYMSIDLLETAPPVELHTVHPNDVVNQLPQSDLPVVSEASWIKFGQLVTLTDWLARTPSPDTTQKHCAINRLGKGRLGMLRAFAAHYLDNPEQLLSATIPQPLDSRDFIMLTGDYDPESPFIDPITYRGVDYDVVTTDGLRRFADEVGIPSYRRRGLDAVLDRMAESWQEKLYYSPEARIDRTEFPNPSLVQLDPEHFFTISDKRFGFSRVLSVTKFLETVRILTLPPPYRQGLHRPRSTGPALDELLICFAAAVLKQPDSETHKPLS